MRLSLCHTSLSHKLLPRRPLALLVLLLLALATQGCQFLQNEFFFYDRATPSPQESADPADPADPAEALD